MTRKAHLLGQRGQRSREAAVGTAVAQPRPMWELLRDSGQPRPRASRRTNLVTTALSVWFTLGLFLDAYAHANFPQLETFFTPWHAVFYSGFAATAGWILWTVWRHVRSGRRGLAAVPVGYGWAIFALPVFAASGGADLLWHTLFGIEESVDIFFSPSHLALIASMIAILTSPLRAMWTDPDLPARPTLRALLPAVLPLAFATGLVLLFLTYGNALLYHSDEIVGAFSVDGLRAESLAAHVVITTAVLIAPLLALARRWHVPPGCAVVVYSVAALISSTITGFSNIEIALAAIAAGVLVDGLAAMMRPTAERRGAFRGFAVAAPLVTWAVYLTVAAVTAGRLPSVPEFWTGMPVIAGLVGWLLAILLLPTPHPDRATRDTR